MAKRTCAKCGSSSWTRIAYGLPGPAMRAAAERGEVALGGCCIEEGSPTRECRDCGLPEGADPAAPATDGLLAP